jgi:dephospho-CoA kinase
MAKKIFGLTGPIASGKGTVKKYIEKKYGSKDCRFSTVMRDILIRIGEETTRENMQKMSTVLRQNFGQNILAKVIAKDVEKIDADIIVIDGVRRISDIEFLNQLPNFTLISIDADPKIRYERMVKRNENKGDDKKTYESFLKDHEADSDYEVPIVMKTAKKSLDNNGDLENLYKQIEQIINS